jgi:phosphate-selective porin OprO/OprP
VAASFLLTGESKSFKGVTPLRDFDPAQGGWGAWELAARVEGLTVDPRVDALGRADPAKSARRAQAWGVGINWYLNKNLRLGLDYEDTRFTGGSAGGNRSQERVLLDRFQIVF